ncbi:MAG: branched-chain amino acid transporter AzlC [Ruminococcaceae bacterium]|nr:branched-chain amino acid transporter AzlC [Oscillospiraceae bacterium]
MLQTEWKNALRAAFPHTLPIMAGYIFLGMAFGFLMRTENQGLLITLMMSSLVYAGSLQYVALTLLAAAFNPLQAFLLTLLVNARHLFYGLAMVERYRNMGAYKLYLIFGLTDETFSVIGTTDVPSGVDRQRFYFLITLLNHLYWVVGSAAGSLLGQFLHFDTSGLDFVLTALFVVIFVNQWRLKNNRVPALIGLLATLACLWLLGPDQFILPAMGLILLLLLLSRPLDPEAVP